MARPPLYDQALRDRLLAATAEMVDDKGPERISLRDIAQKAGTSTSAVYALFGGKTELLVAVIEHGFASFGEAQAAAESEGLRALGFAYRSWAAANPALYRLMFGGGVATDDCRPDDATMSTAIAPLVRALAARVEEPEVMASALTVWAQVHGAVSLELAGVTPPLLVPWDSVYGAVVDAVERAYPTR